MAFLAYYVAYLRMRLWISFRNVLIRIWMRNGPPRFGMLPPTADIRPTLSIRVPSSHDPGRSVAVNIFYPPGASPGSGKKLPVHLHVHGSGFCYSMFPSDTEFAAYVAQKAGCVVLDTDYAKAPAHPFPAAYNDVSDVAAYILSRPDDWDLSRFTISGASSGGCLALSLAVTLPKGTTKAALTFYPATDLSNHPSGTQLVPEKPMGNPGLLLREWERRMMHLAYVPDGVNAEDPRISPIYAPVDAFPPCHKKSIRNICLDMTESGTIWRSAKRGHICRESARSGPASQICQIVPDAARYTR